MISKARIVFDIGMLLLFATMAYASLDFQAVARHFPLYASLAAVALSLVNLVVDVVKLRRRGSVLAGDALETATLQELDSYGEGSQLAPTEALRRAARYWGWLLGFVVLIWLVGLQGAVLLFLSAFLAIEARMAWWRIGASVAATLIVLGAFRNIMNLRWPSSLFDLSVYVPLL